MKGTWVQDPVSQAWHLVWQRNHPDGGHLTGTTWCGKEVSLEWPEKQGSLISFMDICHDECVRASETLGAEAG